MTKKLLKGILVVFLLFACEDKVEEFDGFMQKELEYMLAGQDVKIWERVSESNANDCAAGNYLVFVQDSTGKTGTPKPLLFAYDPALCSAQIFCEQYPDYCASNADLCLLYPAFCNQVGEGFLFIGTWYAPLPAVENGSTDMMVFTINKKSEPVRVSAIDPEHLVLEYSREKPTEEYQFVAPPNND
ncbi:MAG: hypothetical protein HC819_17290 [Cyclobacteriaceae bacterium]|nr:hypothetical protein [Cyclobacteriaceae bacterium]